jgi:hypothetical protein
MGSSQLSAVLALNADRIDGNVSRTSPGVYALDSTSGGGFTYSYVGRSDSDLNARLHSWVGGKYKYFKAAYCSSAKDAFEAECNLYHEFNPPDNSVHPARPSRTSWECPRCAIFDR